MAVDHAKVEVYFHRRHVNVPEEQTAQAVEIQDTLRKAAHTIRRCVPVGAEQTRAITELRHVFDVAQRGINDASLQSNGR